MPYKIEFAARDHFGFLKEIEIASFETLRSVGAVSGDPEASSDEELQRYLDQGLLVAAFDDTKRPVGYVGGYVAGRDLHIAEMDVHPSHQRRGIGRRLMVGMIAQAKERKLDAVTLTTDRHAAFNAPFYASLGFKPFATAEMPERLTEILAIETANGLDPDRRIAMFLVVA